VLPPRRGRLGLLLPSRQNRCHSLFHIVGDRHHSAQHRSGALDDRLAAMEHSPVRDTEIKELVRAALSAELDNVSLLVRSIDASYAYEGYTAFRAEEQ